MNKIYILVPVIGLAVFFSFYQSFSKKDEAMKETARLQAIEDKKQKAIKEREAREAAIAEAVTAQERRKREREEKDRIEEEKKKAFQEANDIFDATKRERDDNKDSVAKLKRRITDIEVEISALESARNAGLAEIAFINKYTEKAEANRKNYYDLLAKVEAAEKERSRQAAETAAAKKKG